MSPYLLSQISPSLGRIYLAGIPARQLPATWTEDPAQAIHFTCVESALEAIQRFGAELPHATWIRWQLFKYEMKLVEVI